MSRLFVAVVIPTGSEERRFPACLRRLGRFERVVLVDFGATVRTCELARTAGPVVVQF